MRVTDFGVAPCYKHCLLYSLWAKSSCYQPPCSDYQKSASPSWHLFMGSVMRLRIFVLWCVSGTTTWHSKEPECHSAIWACLSASAASWHSRPSKPGPEEPFIIHFFIGCDPSSPFHHQVTPAGFVTSPPKNTCVSTDVNDQPVNIHIHKITFGLPQIRCTIYNFKILFTEWSQ